MQSSMFVGEILASFPLFLNIDHIFDVGFLFIRTLDFIGVGVCRLDSLFIWFVKVMRATSICIFSHLGCVGSEKRIKSWVPLHSCLGPGDAHMLLLGRLEDVFNLSLQVFGELDLFVVIRIVPFFNIAEEMVLQHILDKGSDLKQKI